MQIFEVKSNLLHNGSSFKTGQVVQLDKDSVLTLIADKVLRELDVETIAEGESFLAEEAKAKIADDENRAAIVEEDKSTWEPKEGNADTWASKEEKEDATADVDAAKTEDTEEKVEEKTTADEVKTEEVINSDKVEDGANL